MTLPPNFLEERRRLGHDHRDEMWEGVLHMVPQPASRHQELAAKLLAALLPLAEARPLIPLLEAAVHEPGTDDNYRVPEFAFAQPDHVSERGIEGRVELVVEIGSPGDETHDKLPFYAAVGCQEVLVVDRDTLVAEPTELKSLGVRVERTGPDSLRVGDVELMLQVSVKRG